MKIGIIIGVVAVIGLIGAYALTHSNGSSSSTGGALTFAAIQSDVTAGGQLIDVRTPAEFSAGHIDGAINLSLQDIQAGTMPTVAKDQKVYLYCHSGNRSGQATTILRTAGYSNISDLGAMTSVQSIGGTVTN